MDEILTSEATELGKNCGTCDRLRIFEDTSLYPMTFITLDCEMFDVEWFLLGRAMKGTAHMPGASVCPMWGAAAEAPEGEVG